MGEQFIAQRNDDDLRLISCGEVKTWRYWRGIAPWAHNDSTIYVVLRAINRCVVVIGIALDGMHSEGKCKYWH